MALLEVRNLCKSFPTFNVKNVSFSIEPGYIVGFIGRNGAGKTTTIKSILNLTKADSGSVSIFGMDLYEHEIEIKQRIGVVLGGFDYYLDKKLRSIARVVSRFYDNWDGSKYLGYLKKFNLDENKRVKELSEGMKVKLALALALSHHAELLILDEPTSQLDPIAADDFLSTLRKLNEDLGLTVILTEHRLEEALPMADMLAVLENGSLIAYDVPQKAAMQIKNSAVFDSMPAAVRIFSALGGEGGAPLTVGKGRAFIASRMRKQVDITQKAEHKHGDTAVEIKNCWFRYERNSPDVLCGLDLRLYRGEICALLGGNGSGQSTSIGLISGRLKPYRGKVKSNGARVAALPQDPRELFVKDTVSEELAELGSDEAEIARLVNFLELENVLERHPFDLSGGEQQRLALGKVLLTHPDVLLLDEPTKGMDGQLKRRFGELLQKLCDEGKAIFLVSHDVEFCARYADRCALLFRGEIAAEGAPHEFFSGNFFYTTAAAKLSRGMLDGAVLAEEVVECLRQ